MNRLFGVLCTFLLQTVAHATSVCYVGYIMDRYCIDRGTLLDRPSLSTLHYPDK